jgi:hypothetical protein
MKNVCAVLLLSCAGTSLALAQGIEGEKWKVTNTMQMGGMSMPAQKSEICKQPGQDSAPPIRTDDSCQIYDMKRSGNVQSFKMRCTGENAAEGSAQLTYISPDHYKGKMEISTGGETMVMNYEGQKLGQCDGTEANFVAKKIMADAERQQKLAEQQMAHRCHEMAAEANDPFFLMQCKDPADKRTYCEAVRKPENFRRLAQQERRNNRYAANNVNNPNAKPLTESARICGFALEQERDALCKVAEQKNDLNFIATECPSQAASLAAAQCAGRRYTAIAERYRSFCSEYASNQDEELRQQQAGALTGTDDGMAQDQPQDSQQAQPQTTGEKAKGLFNKGKTALGGLFSN